MPYIESVKLFNLKLTPNPTKPFPPQAKLFVKNAPLENDSLNQINIAQLQCHERGILNLFESAPTVVSHLHPETAAD